MSDLVRLPPPGGHVGIVWHRRELAGEMAGSRQGLGCSANGAVAACSFSGSSDNLVVYDYDGTRRWSSGTVLNGLAYASAPVIFDNGDVLGADGARVVRFSPSGGVIWQAPLVDGGTPISPVPTSNGTILVATYGGPLYLLDEATGAVLGRLFVRRDEQDPGFFQAINTPGVRGTRAYVVMHHQTAGVADPEQRAWLAAIDVDRASPDPLRLAWHFEFGGPSGASPLVIDRTIFFDGDRTEPGGAKSPHVFAVTDTGPAPAELWRRPAATSVVASFARDPRPGGGIWTYSLLSPWLLRRSLADGAVLQAVHVDALVGETGWHVPLSAMSIAGPWWQPTMMLFATAFKGGPSVLVAVDLASGSLRWKLPIPDYDGGFAAGQFPLLVGPAGPRIVFSSYGSGVRAVGAF